MTPHTQWLQDPGSYEERRLVFCDIVCFLFVTPLATISGWLCLKGVKDDLQLGSLLQNTGLISLTLVLFTIYSLWTMVTTILVLTTLTFRLLAKDPFLIPPFFFFFFVGGRCLR